MCLLEISQYDCGLNHKHDYDWFLNKFYALLDAINSI